MISYTRSHLDDLHDQGAVSHLDYYLALTMAEMFGDVSPLALLSLALTSTALSEGHICLNLDQAAGTVAGRDLVLPGAGPWRNALEESEMVFSVPDGEGDALTPLSGRIREYPLVLDRDNNLYLAKYYDFQHRLACNVLLRTGPAGSGRAGRPPSPDKAFIARGIRRFFNGQDPKETAGQQAAVKGALQHDFLVISGGPGTGKTHITDIIRQLLDQWARQTGQPPPVVLSMAPTGKAAGRLRGGATIHSILKPRPGGVGFSHGPDNPLAADVVIIDEASMIDIALMTRLLEAVPLSAKVILLGDRNQLSPVQAGAVFSDLCLADSLAGCRVFLTVNFRSRGQGGIENLAEAVNRNDPGRLAGILRSGNYDDLAFEDTGNTVSTARVIETYVRSGYGPLAGSTRLADALANLDEFRILCAHNRGDGGTLQVNHLCEKILRDVNGDAINKPLFRQIVMVTQNDGGLGLHNGDTGVVWSGGREGSLLAIFPDDRGNPRRFRFPDLPAHEPAFAVTIHKSQGSEYGTVLVVIPDRISPVVTRQLLYTGITRARKKVIIAGRMEVIQEAMDVPFDRRSNLVAILSRRPGPETPGAR